MGRTSKRQAKNTLNCVKAAGGISEKFKTQGVSVKDMSCRWNLTRELLEKYILAMKLYREPREKYSERCSRPSLSHFAKYL
uniref:Uncharacterized protein n=1 Tax=Megaselia scalaris TaxID=36166 RepID=T1H3E2_MEGSC